MTLETTTLDHQRNALRATSISYALLGMMTARERNETSTQEPIGAMPEAQSIHSHRTQPQTRHPTILPRTISLKISETITAQVLESL
jgi:hypothetical protein